MPDLGRRSLDGEGDLLNGGGIDVKGIINKITKPQVLSHRYKDYGIDGKNATYEERDYDIYISEEDLLAIKEASHAHISEGDPDTIVLEQSFLECVRDCASFASANCQDVTLAGKYSSSPANFESMVTTYLKDHDAFKDFLCRKDGIDPFTVEYKGNSYQNMFDMVTFKLKSLKIDIETIPVDADLEVQIFTTQDYFNLNYADPEFMFYYPNINFDIAPLEDLSEFVGDDRKTIGAPVATDVDDVLNKELTDIKKILDIRQWEMITFKIKKTELKEVNVRIFYANIADPNEYFRPSGNSGKLRYEFAKYIRAEYSKNKDVYDPEINSPAYLEEFLSREWPILFPPESRDILVMPYTFPFVKNEENKKLSDQGKLGENTDLGKTVNMLSFGRLSHMLNSGEYNYMLHTTFNGDKVNDVPGDVLVEIINHRNIPHPLIVSPAISDIVWAWNGDVIPSTGSNVNNADRDTSNELHMILDFLYGRVMGILGIAEPPEGGPVETITEKYSIEGSPDDDTVTFIYRSIKFNFHQKALVDFRDGKAYDHEYNV